MQIRLIILASLLASACAGPSGEELVETAAASSENDAASRFHGSWTLVSWTDTNEDGETFSPFGNDPFGRITYAPSGKMAVVLMGRERDIEAELESVRDLAELGPDDMRTLVTGFFAYSGSFTVDAEAGTVTHHIEAAFAPNWIGSDRVRAFEILSDNRILLRPREGTSQLTWQREH